MTSQRESVRGLSDLYSVVVAVALSGAVVKLVDANSEGLPIRFELFPYFVAFLATLIPFYHGALRHLDKTYVEERGRGVLKGALLVDFVLLFVEGCMFLGISLLMHRPSAVVWGLTFLLFFDALWGIGAHLLFTQRGAQKAELRWAWINLACVAVLVGSLLGVGVPPGYRSGPRPILGMGLVGILVGRSWTTRCRGASTTRHLTAMIARWRPIMRVSSVGVYGLSCAESALWHPFARYSLYERGQHWRDWFSLPLCRAQCGRHSPPPSGQ